MFRSIEYHHVLYCKFGWIGRKAIGADDQLVQTKSQARTETFTMSHHMFNLNTRNSSYTRTILLATKYQGSCVQNFRAPFPIAAEEQETDERTLNNFQFLAAHNR